MLHSSQSASMHPRMLASKRGSFSKAPSVVPSACHECVTAMASSLALAVSSSFSSSEGASRRASERALPAVCEGAVSYLLARTHGEDFGAHDVDEREGRHRQCGGEG